MTDAELIALLDREKSKAEQGNASLPLHDGEIRPGDFAAVIALNRRQVRSAFVMQWGFRFDKHWIINARSETAANRPMFRQVIRDRRCLIPVSAYFEWDHRVKPFEKYSFAVPGVHRFYLGGVYRFEKDHPLPVCSILTREAAPNIARFHDRMPVIIPAHASDKWLDRSIPPEQLLGEVTTNVNWMKAV